MDSFLLSQYSFGRFTPTLLTIIISLYLFLSKEGTLNKKLLGIYFIFISFFNAGYLFAFTYLSPIGAMGYHLAALTPFGLTALIQFAYRFPVTKLKKESKVVLIISIIISTLSFLDYLINTLQSPICLSGTGYGSVYSSTFIPLAVILFFSWTVIVFLRQSLSISQEDNEEEEGFISSLRYLIFPEGKDAAAARNFALLVLLELINSISIASYMIFKSFSYSIITLSMNIIFMIIYSLYIIFYAFYSEKTIPVILKLISAPLVTLLIIVSLIGEISLSDKNSNYNERNLAELKYVSSLINFNDHSFNKIHKDIDYIIKFKNDSDQKEVLYSKNKIPINCDKLQLWKNLPDIEEILNRKNEIKIDKINFHTPYFARIDNNNYFYYNIKINNTIYGIGFNFLSYRNYIHKSAVKLIIIVIISTIMIIGIFPFLYYRVFINWCEPLKL